MHLHKVICFLQNRKAQVLMPAVLLAPIFVLVIYLLFEMSKVSMTKVRHQFALDNAAYSQVSAATTYLNAVAMLNGPLPYRVTLYYKDMPINKKETSPLKVDKISIFDVFYQAGLIPSVGTDESGVNDPPKADSINWNVHYVETKETSFEDAKYSRRDNWEKENPGSSPPEEYVPVTDPDLADHYWFDVNTAVPALINVLTTYVTVGNIYKAQDYVFKDLTKNNVMFREAYFLNVNDCKRNECARQSASALGRYMKLSTKPFVIDHIHFWWSGTEGKKHYGLAGKESEGYGMRKSLKEMGGEEVFQFAHLTPSSRSLLKPLSRGILLKQNIKLPKNHFNINLERKYKPYVRTRVFMSCPRSGNNCVWPNPLPKYGITLDP